LRKSKAKNPYLSIGNESPMKYILSVWIKLEPRVGAPMKAYRAIGTFRNGRTNQNFTLDVVAADKQDAEHRVFSNFGSRHGASRRFVNIDSLSEIKPTESTEPKVISHFRDTHDFSASPAKAEEE